MAERTNRSHNNLKPWERMGLKVGALVALGAVALAGCGSVAASADHAPAKVTASAPATSGSSESSPAPSETASGSPENGVSPEMSETVLTNSTVYNEMTPADQALVEKDAKLSFDEFEQLPVDERAKVALVLSDAHSAEWLKAAGKMIMPGNNGRPLDNLYVPYSNSYEDLSKLMYTEALNSTQADVTPSSNSQPYEQNQFMQAIAEAMASTGNASLLEDAKKVYAGSLYLSTNQVDSNQVNMSNFGDLAARISGLEQMSKTGKNPAEFLDFPNAAANYYYFTYDLQGNMGSATLGFQVYDQATGTFVDGANNDGATAAVYRLVNYTDKSGTKKTIWVLKETTSRPDRLDIGQLNPDTTS